jgi:hypothetical protein
MIELYKDGDHMAILTDAPDELDFLSSLSQLLGEMIDAKLFEGDWEFQLGNWLPQIVDICCKYRGYKNDVSERRVLCAGNSGFPNIPLVSKIQEGKVIIIDYNDQVVNEAK